MPKSLAKLFRDPTELESAMEILKSNGYKDASLQTIKGQIEAAAALADCELSEEAVNYYQLGLTLGGTIVKVTTDDSKVDQVKALFRSIGNREMTEIPAPWSNSPGFTVCDKMNATNPIDASLSGDFRKY